MPPAPAATAPRLSPERTPPVRRVTAPQRGSDPISRPARLWAGKNGNAPAARFIRHLRADLLAHVGTQPSATQRIAIERAVMLAFHLARMDTDALSSGGMSEHARKQDSAWDGSLRRALQGLGMTAAPAPVPTLEEHLAAVAARQRAARS